MIIRLRYKSDYRSLYTRVSDRRLEYWKGREKEKYIRRRENSGEGSEVREDREWNVSQEGWRKEHKSGRTGNRT